MNHTEKAEECSKTVEFVVIMQQYTKNACRFVYCFREARMDKCLYIFILLSINNHAIRILTAFLPFTQSFSYSLITNPKLSIAYSNMPTAQFATLSKHRITKHNLTRHDKTIYKRNNVFNIFKIQNEFISKAVISCR